MEKEKGKEKKKQKEKELSQLEGYMEELSHPMKAEIEALRKIIKASSDKLSERIKWNAPSYYSKHDLLTFNVRPTDKVHLVFHHIAITKIESGLLEGDYKDRRMMYFKDMEDINKQREELTAILNKYIEITDNMD